MVGSVGNRMWSPSRWIEARLQGSQQPGGPTGSVDTQQGGSQGFVGVLWSGCTFRDVMAAGAG